MREEAQGAEPIVEGDDNRAASRQRRAPRDRMRAAANAMAAAENPDDHRPPLLRRARGRPDVEIEAILAHAAFRRLREGEQAHDRTARDQRLLTDRAEAIA